MKSSFAFYEGAQPGMNGLAKNVLSGALGRKHAADSGAKDLAAADHYIAQTREANAKAAGIEQNTADVRDEPGFISRTANVASPIVERFLRAQSTGNYGHDVQPPTTGNYDDTEGTRTPITEAPPDIAAHLMELARARKVYGVGRFGKDSTAEQLAKSFGEFQGQSITDEVQRRIAAGQDMTRTSAMNQGGKLGTQINLYDNGSGPGTTFNRATGDITGNMPVIEALNAGKGGKKPNLQHTLNDQGDMIAFNPEDGTTQPVIGPDGQPVKGKNTMEKALPPSAAGKLMENQQNLRRAQQALSLISGKAVGGAQADENATGWKGYLPDAALQRLDKGGIDARAAIGDLASLVIHDRSGAAVTASEFPRLRPFIPQVTDDPATVKKKLANFVRVYENIVGETADFYRESGYKVPTEALRDAEGKRSGPPATDTPKRRATDTAAPPAQAPGETLNIGGKNYPVLRYDADGTPIVRTPNGGEARAKKKGGTGV